MLVSVGLWPMLPYRLLRRRGKANTVYLLRDLVTGYYLKEMLNISAPGPNGPQCGNRNFWRNCVSVSGTVFTAHGRRRAPHFGIAAPFPEQPAQISVFLRN